MYNYMSIFLSVSLSPLLFITGLSVGSILPLLNL
jgi:hypothetical protein